MVPTGEMPRSFVVTAERSLVDKVSPGMRVTIIGVFSILHSKMSRENVRTSYIKALGIQKQSGENSLGFAMPNLSEDDKEKIIQLSQDPDIY